MYRHRKKIQSESDQHSKGPLHMSPVDRAGSFPRSRLAILFLTKISICSYEKAGWPGYRDLGNRAGNFSHMNTPARIPGLSVTKLFQLRMACKVADKSERGSTGILGRGAFWTVVISVTRIKHPIWTEDKIRAAYRASPVTGLIWRGPYRFYIGFTTIGSPSSMRDIDGDFCVSVVIWASRRPLRNSEIIRICMGKNDSYFNLKMSTSFQLKKSLPELTSLLLFFYVVFRAI